MLYPDHWIVIVSGDGLPFSVSGGRGSLLCDGLPAGGFLSRGDRKGGSCRMKSCAAIERRLNRAQSRRMRLFVGFPDTRS